MLQKKQIINHPINSVPKLGPKTKITQCKKLNCVTARLSVIKNLKQIENNMTSSNAWFSSIKAFYIYLKQAIASARAVSNEYITSMSMIKVYNCQDLPYMLCFRPTCFRDSCPPLPGRSLAARTTPVMCSRCLRTCDCCYSLKASHSYNTNKSDI